MTRWSLFLQTLSLLHHFLGLYSFGVCRIRSYSRSRCPTQTCGPTSPFPETPSPLPPATPGSAAGHGLAPNPPTAPTPGLDSDLLPVLLFPIAGVSPLLGLEPILFTERVHRLTVYTLLEGTSVLSSVRDTPLLFYTLNVTLPNEYMLLTAHRPRARMSLRTHSPPAGGSRLPGPRTRSAGPFQSISKV